MHEWLHYALHVSEVQIYEYVANLTKEAISILNAFIYFLFYVTKALTLVPCQSNNNKRT